MAHDIAELSQKLFDQAVEMQAKRAPAAHSFLRTVAGLGRMDVAKELLDKTRFTDGFLVAQHNYPRIKRVVDEVRKLFGNEPFSMIDVGGGNGILAHFLPETQYVLCEPRFTGLKMDDVLDMGLSFDCVTSIHVLEHIPDKDKEVFFGQMVKLAKKHIVLCNPVDYGDGTARNEFLYDVFQAQWMKEHIDCGLPKIETFEKLGQQYGLKLEIIPTGSALLSVAMLALKIVANRTKHPGAMGQMRRVVTYLNQNYHKMDQAEAPRDFTFIYTKP